MKNIKKLVWIAAFIVVLGQKSMAQKRTSSNETISTAISYSDLEKKVKLNKDKTEIALEYTTKWISKAKTEKNWKQAVNAYKAIMHLEPKKNGIIYADSLLEVAKKTNEKTIIAGAYLTVGIMYYNKKEVKKALDFYLIADQYSVGTDDGYTLHKIKYSIAQTKYYLGFYEEAIALLKECLLYFEEENDRGYLNTIHSLGLCYNKLGKYELTTYYNRVGVEESKALEYSDMEVYFQHSEAINYYFKKDYMRTIVNLKALLPLLQQNKDTASMTTTYFYIGKSYWTKNDKEKALPYLLKVDQMLQQKNIHRPELRENYELLINWYKSTNNLNMQLSYIKKLIDADKTLTKNYKYLSKRIFKDYDTKKLLQEKAAVEEIMKNKTKEYYIIVAILCVTLFVLAAIQYKNKKTYEKRFEELMQNNVIKKSVVSSTNDIIEISPEVVEMVLKNLDKFEKKKKYLEKDMNLMKLANMLNTNTKYASKIIAKYRGKGTIEYITDLKLQHIIELLKTESKYRNYTNQALGEEAGFNSTQKFTRAFKNRTDISPTFFIQKLKQQETT